MNFKIDSRLTLVYIITLLHGKPFSLLIGDLMGSISFTLMCAQKRLYQHSTNSRYPKNNIVLYLTIVIAANKHELLHRTNLFVFWQVTSFYSLFVAIKHRCFIRLIWFIEIRAIAPSSRASEWCMHVIAVNASELNLLDFLRHFHKVNL